MPCSRPGAHRLRPGALQGTPFEPRGGVGVRCHIQPVATSCGARTFRKHVASCVAPPIGDYMSSSSTQYDGRRSGACATRVVSFRVRLVVAPQGPFLFPLLSYHHPPETVLRPGAGASWRMPCGGFRAWRDVVGSCSVLTAFGAGKDSEVLRPGAHLLRNLAGPGRHRRAIVCDKLRWLALIFLKLRRGPH